MPATQRRRGRYEKSLPRTGVSQGVYDKVERLAKRRKWYLTDVMRQALIEYLNRNELRIKNNPNVK